MKNLRYGLVLASLLFTGCPAPDGDEGTAPSDNGLETATATVAPEFGSSEFDANEATPEAAAPETPAPSATAAAAGNVALTPSNTKIQFVGTHTGDKPDPRTGTFGTFTGQAILANGSLRSIQLEIDTASLSTEIEKLTNHLKSPDFFDVRQHPKATFRSTAIEDAGDGRVTVKGDLTLLGTTKSISFPAKVATDGGLTIASEFTVDRTEFGMDYGVENVEKAVTITVAVGKSS